MSRSAREPARRRPTVGSRAEWLVPATVGSRVLVQIGIIRRRNGWHQAKHKALSRNRSNVIDQRIDVRIGRLPRAHQSRAAADEPVVLPAALLQRFMIAVGHLGEYAVR